MHCGEETEQLLARHPNAFLLLAQIAMRAKWKDCPITGLRADQAFIGDWQAAGLHSEMAYRHAKKCLIDCHLATFKGTNKGTVATLVDTTVFSISDRTGTDKATPEERTSNGQGTTNHTDTQIHRAQPHPSGAAESGADGYERIPTGNQPAFLALETKVQGLKSEWRLPFTYAEQTALLGCGRCLEALTPDDWQTIREYLHARIPEGVPAWQPRQRLKFLETCADVASHAINWKRKQSDRKPAPAVKVRPPEQTPEDKAALAEFLRGGLLKANIQ